MISWVKNISLKNEMFLILFIGFGYFIITNNIYLFNFLTNNLKPQTPNEFGIFGKTVLLILEVTSLLIITLILKIRGCSFSDFKLNFRIKYVGIIILIYIIIYYLWNILPDLIPSFHIHSPKPSTLYLFKIYYWSNFLVFNSINAFFEEFLLLAYLLNRFEKTYKTTTLILISIIIRISYHTWYVASGYGWASLLYPLVMGYLFANFYLLSNKKLLPFFIIHTILDIVPIFYR